MPRPGPRFDEQQLREAVASSYNWMETLRRLGYCPSGSNPKTIKKYVAKWSIDTSHFDPDRARHRGIHADRVPLEQVLVSGSAYSRGHLKARLYSEGLKEHVCEFCGQGENWRGKQMSLILDHINGVRDDNRIENLRIVCPNCAATLPTHCGRGLRKPREEIVCDGCGRRFARKFKKQRFCSRECGQRAGSIGGLAGVQRPQTRKVDRPSFAALMREVEQTSNCAVGRKYGVTEGAVRKWVRAYEREDARKGDDGR